MSSPIVPKKNPANLVISADRWKMAKFSDGSTRLMKSYNFNDMSLRNTFVRGLLSYESETQHSASVEVKEDEVSISLCTKNLNSPTELDKEYAKFADVLFRDVVRS